MKIQDFIQDDLFSLPKTQKRKQGFKPFVFKTLDNYLSKLRSISSFEDLGFTSDQMIYRQEHLITNIKNAINHYYSGKPAEAFKSIKEGVNSRKKNYEELLSVRKFSENTNFYRIRIHSENYSLPSEKFFHIPFELRGKVKTQRFSIPGFPSLYLGTSVYVCWEELNRPNINNFQAVRLISTEPLQIIDLSPPDKVKAEAYEIYKFVMIWPLVFTSSIRVKHNDDTFKPEYIIPQLLLQWVRENENIDGIAYQTTHIDFSETLSEGEFLNIVLPVKDNRSMGLCKSLIQKFNMTEATSIQLIQCATSGAPFYSGGASHIMDVVQKIELVKGRPFSYDISVFSTLEAELSGMPANRIK